MGKGSTTAQRRFIFSNYAQESECAPVLAPVAKEGDIQWGWFPSFSWLLVLWIALLVFLLIAIIIAIVGGPAGLSFGVLLILADIAAIWFLCNWQWNTNKQQAISLARGKRVQAQQLWKNIPRSQKFRAKDLFFQTSYGGKKLLVLRDGTIECHGTHKMDILDAFEKMEDAIGGGGGDGGEPEPQTDEVKDVGETFEDTEVSTSEDHTEDMNFAKPPVAEV